MSKNRANDDQITYWDGTAGETWIENQELLDGQLEAFAGAAIGDAKLTAGSKVIDIGCGCGATTLAAARAIGPQGSVLGVDLSASMLARAAERAQAEGLDNISFRQADAQVQAFDSATVDAVISRFGVMFFDDPAQAFTNIARAMKPGARLSFACWQAVNKNPWMMLPVLEALKLVEMELPTDPSTPGPFAFADSARVQKILEGAGFRDVSPRSFEPELAVAGGQEVERSAEFLMELGPMRRALADADDDLRAAVREAVAGAIAPYETSTGVVMPSAAWIVSAVKA
jgi:SAM-dependent methyltransferase